MKKRNYRAQKVNEIQWETVAQRVKDKAVVLAIDCAPSSACPGQRELRLKR
jgi:hypothetical protein